MEAKYAQAIVEAAESMDMELELYEDYSGKGMYGRKTTGVVGGFAKFAAASAAAAQYMDEDEVDDFVAELAALCHDNLGRQMIFY